MLMHFGFMVHGVTARKSAAGVLEDGCRKVIGPQPLHPQTWAPLRGEPIWAQISPLWRWRTVPTLWGGSEGCVGKTLGSEL